jgi:uncharacterized membrane protein YcaP (DUF421 family)
MALVIDWQALFVPSLGIAEVVVRGTIMYLALFLMLRFVSRRQAGNFATADLLVIVLIADAAQNALGKDYSSVTEGIALVATIVAWEYILDWLAWQFPRLRPVLRPAPLKLVEDGKLLSGNMQREMLTEDELRSQLRQKAIEDIAEVRVARLEGDGQISVLKKKRG